MENELQSKNIVISKIEQLTWGIKIYDEKGLIYNIPQFKKGTQEQTSAYTTISFLPANGMGLQKCFKFVTVANNQGGQSRYVRIIGEPEASTSPQELVREALRPIPQYTPPQPKNAPQGNTGRSTEDNIRWCNALNNACLLVGKFCGHLEIDINDPEVERIIINKANWIYKLEPKKSYANTFNTPEPLPEEIGTVVGHKPSYNEHEDEAIQSIPF